MQSRASKGIEVSEQIVYKNPMQTTIILCRPETSANIGAVCRVMANTDFTDLRIVGNKEDYCENEVLKLALHADSIWKNAIFFPPDIQGLKAVSSDCNILAGTTRRNGQKRKHTGITPDQLCSYSERFKNSRLGLLFGNERTGLTDEELNLCSFSINIPASENFGSYNLSHAVLILTYSLFNANLKQTKTASPAPLPEEKPASMNLIRENACQICDYLSHIGMFKTGGKSENETFFMELLSSAGATEFQTNHLVQIFKKILYIKEKN